MTLDELRLTALALLPLDDDRREMGLVLLAFLAQAAVVPELAEAAEGAGQRLQEPLAARIAYAVRAGEFRPTLTQRTKPRACGCSRTGFACSSSPLRARPRPRGQWRYWMTISPCSPQRLP